MKTLGRAPGWRARRLAADQRQAERPTGPQLPPRRRGIWYQAVPAMQPPRHFIMRVKRDGPLVPARLWFCDYEPGVPDNKLDRGCLSVYPRAAVADVEVDPGIILDRLGIWQRQGDIAMPPWQVLAALADPSQQTPRPVGHWAYAQPIDAAEYDYQIDRLRWADRNRPEDPALHPRRAIDPRQMALPSFDRENAL